VDVVTAVGSASWLGQPWMAPAVRERHDQRPGGLPLPRLSEPVRETSAYYAVTTVDGLVVAHPHQRLLVVYTMTALNAMVLGYHSSLTAEVSA
jgi:hypothetical protein